MDLQLRHEQNGFRPNRSCVDHINTLRIIVEQSVEWRSPLFLLFVDFERAFDTIHRDAIWKALYNVGVPEKIINLIRELYCGASCSVRFKGICSNKFQINVGVRQGCVLSPLLFILVLDEVIRKTNAEATDGIQWRLNQRLCDLDYADDICFMSHTLDGAKLKLRSLAQNAAAVGLKINMSKTKLLRLQTTITTPLAIEHRGEHFVVDDVDKFCYLGSTITKDGGTITDVDARISKAHFAFKNLSKVWRSNVITRKTKLRIFNTSIIPVLLYGSETWMVTDHIKSALQVFINKRLRIICRVFHPDTISNEDLWRSTNTVPINVTIKRRKWRWIGHVLRRENDNIAKMAFQWNPQGSRRTGRPNHTWCRTVKLESRHLASWNEIRHIASDRIRWEEFVNQICS